MLIVVVDESSFLILATIRMYLSFNIFSKEVDDVIYQEIYINGTCPQILSQRTKNTKFTGLNVVMDFNPNSFTCMSSLMVFIISFINKKKI